MYKMDRTSFKKLLDLKHSPQVNQFADSCGFKIHSEGNDRWVNLDEVVKAVVEKLRDKSTDKKDLETEKLQHEITKLKLNNAKTLMESRARAGELCDVAVVKKSLQILANELRTTGDLFARKKTLTGPEAQDLLNAALDRTEQSLEQFD